MHDLFFEEPERASEFQTFRLTVPSVAHFSADELVFAFP
jgi:hypothetical protein